MMGRVGTLLVLVNGLPGAGKSTVGRALAQVSGARFLSKDAVKEALATCVEDPAGLTDLGGIAMDAVWSLAPRLPPVAAIQLSTAELSGCRPPQARSWMVTAYPSGSAKVKVRPKGPSAGAARIETPAAAR